jgi:hypothetical protein
MRAAPTNQPRGTSGRPQLVQAMIDAFRTPDLRGKILFTLFILMVFRFLAHVPVPGADRDVLGQVFQQNDLVAFFDLFSGGGLRNLSVVALGVYPYITATFNVAGTNVKVYATITNLLNTQHIINVYNRTGDAYDDGFLSDPDLSSLIIQSRGPEYVEMYEKINLSNRNHWLNDHGFDLFGIPQEIKTGIQVSF